MGLDDRYTERFAPCDGRKGEHIASVQVVHQLLMTQRSRKHNPDTGLRGEGRGIGPVPVRRRR